MSDFLTRLAGRSLGVEPLVQPVIPAMTAPVSRGAGFTERESVGEPAGEQRAATESPVSPQIVQHFATRVEQAPAAPAQGRPESPTSPSLDVPRALSRSSPGPVVPRNRELFESAPVDDARDVTIPSESAPFTSSPAHPVTIASDRREPAASAPPIVRVTIGRIEVKAELASPKERTAAAHRPKSAAISLDDYLKQRAEGRR